MPRQSLRVEVIHAAGIDVVRVAGELDLYTAILLRDAVDDPDRCAAPVMVLDLNGIGFIDSQGVACIATVRRIVSARGAELVLAVEVPTIRRLMRITGLDQVLRIVANEAVLVGGVGVEPGDFGVA